LNFDPESQEISAMIKCPRCNLQQETSPQCEYCGLIFKEFMESAQTSKTAYLKRTSLFVIILIVAGALLAASWFIFSRHKSGEKSTIAKSTRVGAQSTKENDLRTTAKELSGDGGIIKRFAGGSTKGSIIAMVIFSVIGLGYFTYGKKSQQLLMLICGIALMGYSYFVDGTVYIILIGAGLSALPFILGRK
jgi:hypothetical protein